MALNNEFAFLSFLRYLGNLLLYTTGLPFKATAKGYISSDYKKPFAVSSRPILNGLLGNGYEIVLEKRYIPYINGKKPFAKALVQICQNLSVPHRKI